MRLEEKPLRFLFRHISSRLPGRPWSLCRKQVSARDWRARPVVIRYDSLARIAAWSRKVRDQQHWEKHGFLAMHPVSNVEGKGGEKFRERNVVGFVTGSPGGCLHDAPSRRYVFAARSSLSLSVQEQESQRATCREGNWALQLQWSFHMVTHADMGSGRPIIVTSQRPFCN